MRQETSVRVSVTNGRISPREVQSQSRQNMNSKSASSKREVEAGRSWEVDRTGC